MNSNWQIYNVIVGVAQATNSYIQKMSKRPIEKAKITYVWKEVNDFDERHIVNEVHLREQDVIEKTYIIQMTIDLSWTRISFSIRHMKPMSNTYSEN